MKKDIKDYLHFYLPYNIKCQTPDGIGILCTYSVCGAFGFGMNPGYKEFMPEEGITPYLKPLNSLTGSELKWYGGRKEFDHLEFAYLLQQEVDLFRLIESGLAFDKTTLKTNG